MKARLYQLSGPLGKVGAAWCAPNGARLLTKIPGFLKHIFFSLNKQA